MDSPPPLDTNTQVVALSTQGAPLIAIPLNEDNDPTPFTEVVAKRKRDKPTSPAKQSPKKPVRDPFLTPIFIDSIPDKLRSPIAFVRALLQELKGIDVKNIRPTRTGYVLDVPSQQEADRLLKNIPSHIGKAHAPHAKANPLKLVLKGVSLYTEMSDIQNLLQDSGISLTSEIIRIRNTRSGQPLPLLLVKTVDDSKSRGLLESGELRIGPLSFKVEEFVLQPRNIQCFKCMAFGHQAGSCTRKTRCSFCGMSGHTYKDCQRKKAGHPPSCALCQGAHAANSSACPHRRAALEKILSQERFRDTRLAKEFFSTKTNSPPPRLHDTEQFPPMPTTSATKIPRPSPTRPKAPPMAPSTPPRPQKQHQQASTLSTSPPKPMSTTVWGNSSPSRQPLQSPPTQELAQLASDLAVLQKQVNDLVSALTPLLALIPLLTQWTTTK